ncbi:MAG: phytanoyl-CoA dioxygenase family protein [Candidatus Obscuribacterales bacterium]|nr:phytanoyl-CoA dioxygenase family protein [Candidatus Obscuribacterales bacterium]
MNTSTPTSLLRQTPWVEDPDFELLLKSRKLSERDSSMAREFARDGFLIIESADLFDDVDINALKEFVIAHPGSAHNRITDGWKDCPEIKKIACNPEILRVIEFLYEREVIPFQTLNFLRGTEQRTHADFIHFASLPARYMCGVWVALEDVTLKSGPLHYYEGSHKLPEFSYQDLGIELISEKGGLSWENPETRLRYNQYETLIAEKVSPFPRRVLTVKMGTALIWSSNLLHGGNPVDDRSVTRWSQVTHYFFENTVSIVPMFSNMQEQLYAITAPTEIRTGKRKENKFNGRYTHLLPDGARFRIRTSDEPQDIQFDPERSTAYLLRYADLAGSSFATPEGAFEHFLKHGIGEGRVY